MSKATAAAATEPEVQEPELEPIWLAGQSAPLFIGDVKDVAKKAFGEGYQVFYVLGQFKDRVVSTSANGTKSTTYSNPEPRVFKVVNTLVGSAINVVQNDALGLEKYDETAYFKMPKMPWLMVSKLDTFFRKVEKELKTEAIVVLTYDTRHNDENGWGVIIPKQTNTAGNCKYDPASILDLIPDDDQEFIVPVGTVHSHPGMSAYASHTDHNDQVGNDGIHITFGWYSGRATEYHIEMQLGGGTFELEADQVFSNIPAPPEFPELKEWVSRVSKVNHTPSSSYTPQSGGGSSQNWNHNTHKKSLQLPDGIPDPADVTLVLQLESASEEKCPMCGAKFKNDTIPRRRCWDCMAFLALPGESIQDIYAVRDIRQDAPVYELDPERCATDMYTLSIVEVDGKPEYDLKLVHSPEENSPEGNVPLASA